MTKILGFSELDPIQSITKIDHTENLWIFYNFDNDTQKIWKTISEANKYFFSIELVLIFFVEVYTIH